MTREAKAKADSWGQVAGSVSKKTDYVFGRRCGIQSQESRELGVTTLSEQDWLALID